jgi:hypothetical protein
MGTESAHLIAPAFQAGVLPRTQGLVTAATLADGRIVHQREEQP